MLLSNPLKDVIPQVVDLKDHVSELIRQLHQVTDERNRYQMALKVHEEAAAQQSHPSCGGQRCSRYEERIVELHSVIAELSRKLQVYGIYYHLHIVVQH